MVQNKYIETVDCLDSIQRILKHYNLFHIVEKQFDIVGEYIAEIEAVSAKQAGILASRPKQRGRPRKGT